MDKHPMAGFPVKIEKGPLKGHYFKVVDYLVNQYQGKRIEKIAKSQEQLVTPVVGRGYPLDDKIVFGQLYLSGIPRDFICVHDDELLKVQPPLKLVDDEEKEKEDDAGTTSEGDSKDAVTGQPEPDGRSVPSSKGTGKPKRTNKKKG